MSKSAMPGNTTEEINPYQSPKANRDLSPLLHREEGAPLSWWTGASAILAAAIAMACTTPGRTHGLGLITTRLLADFPEMGEVGFAQVNVVATLLGSLLCLPCGWLLDRIRTSIVAGVTLLLLGLSVCWMGQATSVLMLAVAITLTRGIGQSMLSVVSLAIIGKAFPKRPGAVMGAYAVLMTMMMAVWMGVLGWRVSTLSWREVWRELGMTILVLAPLLWLLTPNLKRQGSALNSATSDLESERTDATLSQALATPCFWMFAISISLFGMISAGISLFQQSIFAARGIEEGVYQQLLVVGLLVGLVANIIGGLLATKLPLQVLQGIAMLLLAVALGMLPNITSVGGAYAFCLVYGVGGGWLTVLFFTVWGQAFGTRSLGKIQGAAQMLTVLASAVGPLLVAESNARFDSYNPIMGFYLVVCVVLGIGSFFVKVPSAIDGDWEPSRRSKQAKLLSEGL